MMDLVETADEFELWFALRDRVRRRVADGDDPLRLYDEVGDWVQLGFSVSDDRGYVLISFLEAMTGYCHPDWYVLEPDQMDDLRIRVQDRQRVAADEDPGGG